MRGNSLVRRVGKRSYVPANAQETETSNNNIKQLLKITGAANISQQILAQLLVSMKSQYPQVPQQAWDAFLAELKFDDLFCHWHEASDRRSSSDRAVALFINVNPQILLSIYT